MDQEKLQNAENYLTAAIRELRAARGEQGDPILGIVTLEAEIVRDKVRILSLGGRP